MLSGGHLPKWFERQLLTMVFCLLSFAVTPTPLSVPRAVQSLSTCGRVCNRIGRQKSARVHSCHAVMEWLLQKAKAIHRHSRIVDSESQSAMVLQRLRLLSLPVALIAGVVLCKEKEVQPTKYHALHLRWCLPWLFDCSASENRPQAAFSVCSATARQASAEQNAADVPVAVHSTAQRTVTLAPVMLETCRLSRSFWLRSPSLPGAPGKSG